MRLSCWCVATFSLARVSIASVVADDRLLALRGGSFALPQTVIACAGGAVSISGFASLVDPKWIPEQQSEKRLGPLKVKVKRRQTVGVIPRAVGGLALVGWGITKVRA